MHGFAFRTGLTFEWSDVPHRIERIGADDQVILERLNDGKIVLSSKAELLVAFSAGEIAIQAIANNRMEPSHYSRSLGELPEPAQHEIRRRLSYVRAIDETGIHGINERNLVPLIAAVAARINDLKPPSWITVYRWHRKFRGTKQTRTLVPRHDLRGNRSHRQSDRLLTLFAQAAEEAFHASPGASLASIHTRFTKKIQAENHHLLPEEQLLAPALRTSYRIFKQLPAFDQTLLKEGKGAAESRYRVAKAAPQVGGILQRVEADHTPLDLFLIDERTGLPLGRPILTLFLDSFSRFPLGYFLNFGGASAAAVMGALRHAILPKVPVPEVIPGLHIEHAWPCYGVMDCLALDNGLEFHGTALEGAAMDLGIYILYCPKRQPWYKGKIERFLKTLNFSLCHQMPGTSLARLADRGEYDPQKHAMLTMAEFKHVLEKWLLDIYAQSYHKGLASSPWLKWHEGLKHRVPELPGSLDDLQRRIGLIEERRLQRDGLTLKGIRYAGPELDSIMRAWGPGVKLRIVYDPEDMGAVQVWAPEEQEAIRVQALDQNYANGLTLVQHELIQQQMREQFEATGSQQTVHKAKSDLIATVDNLLRSSKQRTRRRAAKLQGITSSHPQAQLQNSPPISPKVNQKQLLQIDDEVPPSLPTFRFKRKDQ
ncbi:Mu transposase C-terminal domain-containing protein [Comamonas thiooxydans]|uniref:Mu transposase C-terminal domain-containing protein n=1 Tax=Comamonas thiooxydans TaxID=363952 RepID=UPI0007C488B3|nr:Mu transposase C-terminal domain-containing protein [Comamonas thiooxydans]